MSALEFLQVSSKPSLSPRQLRWEVLHDAGDLEVGVFVGTLDTPETRSLSVPEGSASLFWVDGPAIILTPELGNSIRIVPRSSLVFFRSGTVDAQFGRGLHSVTTLTWNERMMPPLHRWLNATITANPDFATQQIASVPAARQYAEPLVRLREALNQPKLVEPILFGILSQIIPPIWMSKEEFQLTPLPEGLPDTILDLIRSVKRQPEASWPLRDASLMVGYSPFHFSRYFKQLVGYGFHEFVERARTEMAIQSLLSTADPIELVSSRSGFGTTQAMREALKDYVGLVPSEIRSSNEMLGLGI